ncbi:hypothetical protein AB0F15_38030 [Amycolatopsis sp. NPDC026612]|uniref:hypothetical protein n=1 Tax=Amycolatopsis sp. NPDC026612 TaxID=3155466 RepID=UPI0033C867C9
MELELDKRCRSAALELLDWDETTTIRAWVVRDIMRGRLAGAADPHGLRLCGARIEGRVDLENIASGLSLELSHCLLGEGLVARDAKLGGLYLTSCRLEHPSEPVLDAQRLVTSGMGLIKTIVEGDCPDPAVDVSGGHFGLFECSGAKLRNPGGAALNADGLKVDQYVHLKQGFEAVGSGDLGAVRLVGAHFGTLDFRDSKLCNESGAGLEARSLTVERYAYLSDNFRIVGGGDHVALRLTDVCIAGVLEFSPAKLEHRSDSSARIDVDGLVYPRLPRGISLDTWLSLLRGGTRSYAAQPYQHLAAVYRAAGHEGQTRRILMGQRVDQIDRGALTSRAERVWARITGLTLGYGYQPWRALIGLGAVLAVAVTLAVIPGSRGGLAHPPLVGGTPVTVDCTVAEEVGVGLDFGTPLINSGARARCEPTSTPNGQILAYSGWVLRLLAWSFATLFVAGFTGAVRKT